MKHFVIRLSKREALACDTDSRRDAYAANLVYAAESLRHPRKPHIKCTGIMIDEGVSGDVRELFDPDPFAQTRVAMLIQHLRAELDSQSSTADLNLILRCRADITTAPDILIHAGKADWLHQLPRAHWEDRCESEGYSPNVAWDMRPGKLGEKVKRYEQQTGNVLIPYAGARSVKRQQGEIPTVSAWAVLVKPTAYYHVAQWLTRRAQALGIDHVSMSWKHHDVKPDGQPISWEKGRLLHHTRPIPTPVQYPGIERRCFADAARMLDANGIHLVCQHYPPTRTRLEAQTLELVEDFGTLRTDVKP